MDRHKDILITHAQLSFRRRQELNYVALEIEMCINTNLNNDTNK